jgi:hypothetical protein
MVELKPDISIITLYWKRSNASNIYSKIVTLNEKEKKTQSAYKIHTLTIRRHKGWNFKDEEK